MLSIWRKVSFLRSVISMFSDHVLVCNLSVFVLVRLVTGQSITLRRVVPILGVPDALVPLDLPVSQISLSSGYESN